MTTGHWGSETRIGTSAERDLREQADQRRAVLADRVCRVAAGIGLGWLALYALLIGLSHGSPAMERFVGDGIYLLPLVVATVLGILAARRARGRSRRMWTVLAASLFAWLTGEAIWTGYSYLAPGGTPFPSVADVFYLLSYALAIPAILLGFGRAGSLRQVRGLLDAGLVVLALGALGWQFLVRPQLDGEPASLAVVVTAAQPLLAMMLLGCLVAIGMAGHRMVPYSVQLIGMAFVTAVLADACYTYLVVVREYTVDSWTNLGWQVEAVLICLAALVAIRHRETDARVEKLDRDLTLVPVLAAALASFVLIVVDDVATGTVHRSTLTVAGVMLVGLLVRQFLFTRDRSRLARELQGALREQERLAVTDGLTGLYNRRFLLEMLKLEADRAARTRRPLSLAVIDLDHFKLVNDMYGHPAGDLVLVQAADRIRQMSRGHDIVARYGGEEFVVLLPDTDDEVALELAERFRRALRRTPVTVVRGHDIAVTGSVGVATAAPDPVTGRPDTERLVAEADRALYQAKAQGRDRTVVAGSAETGAEPETLGLPPALLWLADRIDASLGGYEHSTAVQRWCRLLGERLGLGATELGRLAAAGRLHDIGKISVDRAILSKPGRLDAQEWVQLRRHCQDGARLLRDVGRCAELAPLVEAHHEWYDGTGYPHGLAGGRIPLESRIIAVCDSWAAMRVDRAYSRAKSVAEARREVELGRGTQFDPRVADAFLALVDAGLIDDPKPLPATGTAPVRGGQLPVC